MTIDTEQALRELDRLVGTWSTRATHPSLPGVVVPGTTRIEWLEGNRFLIFRGQTEHPDFPDAIWIIGFTDRDRVDGDDSTASRTPQLSSHYFDSRGVFRVYEVGVDAESLRFWRTAPGLSQRFSGSFADGGDTIDGLWQVYGDDAQWNDDLKITFRRQR